MMSFMSSRAQIVSENTGVWSRCRFLTASVLPVRMACNCRCRFCFSKSSLSTLEGDFTGYEDLPRYLAFARARGASRLVVTGGGEPLLRKERVLDILWEGRKLFGELALFSNAAHLDESCAEALAQAGLSYLCYSRHHYDDAVNRQLMGDNAPALDRVLRAAAGLTVRATCVMAGGYIDSRDEVFRYIDALAGRGVRQLTFKHTYVAYPHSVAARSPQNRWAQRHHVSFDPFADLGYVVARLPWGPAIRKLGELQVCYYWEPTPEWEKENLLCRSVNLLSSGKVYASLEDAESFLFRLGSWPGQSWPIR
jgi:cyclic pyranopterin phosphate synthase